MLVELPQTWELAEAIYSNIYQPPWCCWIRLHREYYHAKLHSLLFFAWSRVWHTNHVSHWQEVRYSPGSIPSASWNPHENATRTLHYMLIFSTCLSTDSYLVTKWISGWMVYAILLRMQQPYWILTIRWPSCSDGWRMVLVACQLYGKIYVG